MREMPPKYQVLYEKLKQEIESGTLPVGSKIPSETQLMNSYGYSRQTVRKSLDELVVHGYIHKIQGSGSFVRKPVGSSITGSRNILLMVLFFDHFFFPEYIKGIQDALRVERYSLTIKSSNYSQEDEEDQLNEALQGEYAGIMLFPAHSAEPYRNLYLYRKIARLGIPFITLGSKVLSEDIPFVGVDDFTGGELMTQHMIEKGHKEIAIIINRHEASGFLRYAGYVSALSKNGIRSRPERLIYYDPPVRDTLFAQKNQAELLERLEGVTAVFCFNDDVAVTLCNLLQSSGRRVPQDISVAGYDDSHLCALSFVPLCSINQDPFAIGQMAGRNIVKLIHDPTFCAEHVSMPTLMARESVRDIRSD